MEQAIAVQTASPQPTLRARLGLQAGQMAGGDGFSMIFAQMMNQDDPFQTVIAQMMENTLEDTNELGAQMSAEMMYMMPSDPSQTILSLEQPQNLIPGATKPSEINYNFSVEPLPSDISGEGKDTAPELDTQVSKEFFTILQDARKDQAQPTLDFPFQDKSLRAAKELVSQKQKDVIPPVNIERLQADVDAGRFLPVEAVIHKQTNSLPDITDIASQLKSGILENLAQEKNEFVVRLKPEGIGEIIVKLSENKEKISLSIFTSSTQTAKLITNEVAALQNALRPLHAEVQQIAITPDGHASDYAAQTAMTNQEHHFQGQQFFGREQHRASQSQIDGEFSSTVEQILSDDGLDTYI